MAGGHMHLIDMDEVAAMARRYGEPRRIKVRQETGEDFFRLFSRRVEAARGEVLFLLPRPGGILLHSKRQYPPHTWRLLTGTINAGERVEEALAREPQEEVGLSPAPVAFLALIEYEFVWNGETVPWVTYVFRMEETVEPFRPSVDDEVAATREVAPPELREVAMALEGMADGWADWGRYRAVAHRVVADLLEERA